MPGKDDPLDVGNFGKPLVTPPQKGVTETALKNAEAQLDAEAVKDEEALKPMQSYADRLREAGVPPEKASKIIDDILLKGHYSEAMPITKSMSVTLRTRTARDTRRIQDLLEAERPQFDQHYRELMTRLLLAASLEQCGADKLPHPTSKKATRDEIETMFQERISYVENQVSDPLLRLLFQKLWKFDQMVTVVLEEGAIENF